MPKPTPTTLSAPEPLAVQEPSRLWLLALPLLFLGLSCGFAPFLELSADEAYYWAWSRQIAGGYFDHPPMVAWLIRLSTGVFGHSEFAVRFPGIVLMTATVLAGVWGMSFVTKRFWDLLMAEAALLALPVVHVLGLIHTPDTPAAAFLMLTAVAGLWCVRSPSLLSYGLMGVAGALAMLSKYTALLPVVAVFAFLLLRDWRQWPRVLFAGLLTCAVMTPLLLWNYQHDWVSFRYQLAHGTEPDDRSWWMNLGDYIGAQLLVGTPILLPLGLWISVRALLRGDAIRRLLAVCALTPLAFFAFTSLSHKVEANWPSLAYCPLVLLLAIESRTTFASQRPTWFTKLFRLGLHVALGMTIAVHLPPAVAARIAPRSPIGGIGGWEQFARELAAMANGRPIACTKYQDASLMSFYLRRRPAVTILREVDSRPTQADVVPGALPEGPFLLVTDHGAMHAGTREPFWWNGQSITLEILQRDLLAVELDGLYTRGRPETRTRYILTCTLVPDDAAAQTR